VRQAIGGTLRQAGVLTAAARNAVDVNFGTGPGGEGNVLKRTHVLAQRIAEYWLSLGGSIEHPVHTNMVWIDLKKAAVDPQKLRDVAKEKGVKLTRGRIVVHYQITEQAVRRLEEVLTAVMQ
jgi:threonine aldolase